MTASEPNAPPIAEVYIDESSTQHRYLVVAAIVVPHIDADAFVATMSAARMPELPRDEMKWTKVSRTKLEAYRRVVNTFFDATGGTLDFHAVVIDTTKQKHQIYNQGNREIGFNKEVYQLAMKCGRYRVSAQRPFRHAQCLASED